MCIPDQNWINSVRSDKAEGITHVRRQGALQHFSNTDDIGLIGDRPALWRIQISHDPRKMRNTLLKVGQQCVPAFNPSTPVLIQVT